VHKGRLEAFSDGVLAIIITIMVLELRPPHEPSLAALRPVLPRLASYLLSFVYLGIYWNNHHHLLQAAQRVDGRVLWANLHLLFWLSLVPFVTDWLGESGPRPWPVALYGLVLLVAGAAYYLLERLLVAGHGRESALGRAVGSDVKSVASLVIYGMGVPLAFVVPWLSIGCYVLVAILWVVPDRRIERVLAEEQSGGE